MLKERFLSLGRKMSQTHVTFGNIVFDIRRHPRPKKTFSKAPQTAFDTNMGRMNHGNKFLAYTGRKNQTRALTSDFLSGTSFILSCNLLLLNLTSRSSHLSRSARRSLSWSFIGECHDSSYQHPSTLQSTHSFYSETLQLQI